MKILEKIGLKKRRDVGISISSNNFIELICIDKTTKSVINYASDNIKYNSSIREIIDYNELKEVLERLFESAGLNPKECFVSLSIPNVYFGITLVDSVSDDDFIRENIIQPELEDLYIFKREGNEAAISYVMQDNGSNAETKNVVYSAIQAKAIVKILDIFDGIGAEVVRIDTSYTALFKAIQFCDGRFNHYFSMGNRNLIVLVNSNSCSTFFFNGANIEDFYESPLAIKSFSNEEVYNVVSQIADDSIERVHPDSILLISETEEVDTEILSQKIKFSGTIDGINKNVTKNEQIIGISSLANDIDSGMISYMTIEAIGAAAANYDEYPININFMPVEKIQKNLVRIGSYYVPFTNFLLFVIVIAIAIACAISFALNTVINMGIAKIQESNEQTVQDINVFQASSEQNSNSTNAEILPIITEIINKNKDIVDAYDALSIDIPDSIYVSKFTAKANVGIGIQGESRTSEDAQTFSSNLNVNNPDLILRRISANTLNRNPEIKIPDGYSFEITTSDNVNFTDFDFIRNGTSNIDNYEYNSGSSEEFPPPPII